MHSPTVIVQILQEAVTKGWDQMPQDFICGSDCARERQGARDAGRASRPHASLNLSGGGAGAMGAWGGKSEWPQTAKWSTGGSTKLLGCPTGESWSLCLSGMD